eukprot:GILK01012122.1.p2 GENE.GILK01012122.1~~GILK01012122.1.p2  ORF type:complete len:186 (-),score=23.82 GILK01012122.1:89-646(-)
MELDTSREKRRKPISYQEDTETDEDLPIKQIKRAKTSAAGEANSKKEKKRPRQGSLSSDENSSKTPKRSKQSAASKTSKSTEAGRGSAKRAATQKGKSYVESGSDQQSESDSDSEHESDCRVCGDDGEVLCCDTCPLVYHTFCLNPPLVDVPEGAWSCPICQGQTLPDVCNIHKHIHTYTVYRYI